MKGSEPFGTEEEYSGVISILMQMSAYRADASIELCHVVADQGVDMVGDAKGWLPMWVQKLGVLGLFQRTSPIL